MASVKDLLSVAKQDLRTIKMTGTISEASKVLATSRNRMIVVSKDGEEMAGVLTRADILQAIYSKMADSDTNCGAVMVTSVHSCEANDVLDDVWAVMSKHNLNAMPVIDHNNVPIGVLSSKCVLVKLLSEARKQDQLMQDYIHGMGYH